jgi:hypothetical protein
MPEDTKLLTPDDVEREYQIRKGTQAAMRHRKQIPYVQIGPRLPRYRRCDLDAWIAARAVAPGQR